MKLSFYNELTDFTRLPASVYKTELALWRMEQRQGLTAEDKKIYTDYLRTQGADTVEEFIDMGYANIFPLLLKHGVINKKNITSFCDAAREKRKNEIHAFLLNGTNILRSRKAVKELQLQNFAADINKAKPGDILWLGKGPTPWKVLENKNGRLLLLSVYALACMPYKNFYMGNTVYSLSTLKIKLQGEYLNELFDSRDIEKIIPVYIDDDTDELFFEQRGKTQADRLFVLSDKEAAKYMKIPCVEKAPATRQCLKTPLWTVFSDYAYWWLRSPGNHPVEKMYVKNGIITSEGSIVNGDWEFDYFGLRPAVYYRP